MVTKVGAFAFEEFFLVLLEPEGGEQFIKANGIVLGFNGCKVLAVCQGIIEV
jgi:hypothetical protein